MATVKRTWRNLFVLLLAIPARIVALTPLLILGLIGAAADWLCDEIHKVLPRLEMDFAKEEERYRQQLIKRFRGDLPQPKDQP